MEVINGGPHFSPAFAGSGGFFNRLRPRPACYFSPVVVVLKPVVANCSSLGSSIFSCGAAAPEPASARKVSTASAQLSEPAPCASPGFCGSMPGAACPGCAPGRLHSERRRKRPHIRCQPGRLCLPASGNRPRLLQPRAGRTLQRRNKAPPICLTKPASPPRAAGQTLRPAAAPRPLRHPRRRARWSAWRQCSALARSALAPAPPPGLAQRIS